MSVSNRFHDEYFSSNVVDNYFQSKAQSQDEKDVLGVIDVLKELGKLSDDNEKMGTLLDVGCGYGVTTSLMAKYFNYVIGTDASPNQVKQACEISHPDNVEFKTSTAESLPVADCSVDVIAATFAIHYFNISAFIQECRRVLKPQGVVVIYSDFLSTFEAFEDEKLPVIQKEIRVMKANCYAIAQAASHPAHRLLDDLHDVFEEIEWPGKQLLRRKTAIETDLARMRHHYLSIPLYASLGTTTENPVIRAFDNINRTWKMEGIAEKDMEIKATFDASVIVLKQGS